MTIGCVPPLGFINDVKGTETINSVKIIKHIPPVHKLRTRVITQKISLTIAKLYPCIASNTCCARMPSVPLDVPLENNLMHQKIVSTLATRQALKNKVVDMEGGVMYRCLA